MLLRILSLIFFTVGVSVFGTTDSQAGPYLDSAHGSNVYGVARTALLTANFAKGNCAHCHEQHASINSSEPAPADGIAKAYMVFDGDNNGQTTNFCFSCHVGTGGYQDGGPVLNRSYSYRAGGWSGSPISDVKTSFDPGQASSHNLLDVVTFAADPTPNWKYTANSNACVVCHDPHVVKGDPANDTISGKGTLPARPGVITEVNSSPPNLWGDVATESMFNYASPNPYLAPNCFAGASEPVCGDATNDGSDLPDYVTFCSKCHYATVSGLPVTSTGLGVLRDIDWTNGGSGAIHGKVAAVSSSMLAPYASGATAYVLSCLDCHEPHGSANIYLLRGEVNGAATTTIASGLNFGLICGKCHNPFEGGGINWDNVHHAGADAAYAQGVLGTCNACHPDANGTQPIDCSTCHYHGAITGAGTPLVPQTTIGPLNRKIF